MSMRVLFAVLVAASAALGLSFVIMLGPPRRSAEPSMAWLQAMLAWVAVAFDVALLVALFHIAVPAWIYALVLLAQDAVFAWRLGVLYRSRRG